MRDNLIIFNEDDCKQPNITSINFSLCYPRIYGIIEEIHQKLKNKFITFKSKK